MRNFSTLFYIRIFDAVCFMLCVNLLMENYLPMILWAYAHKHSYSSFFWCFIQSFLCLNCCLSIPMIMIKFNFSINSHLLCCGVPDFFMLLCMNFFVYYMPWLISLFITKIVIKTLYALVCYHPSHHNRCAWWFFCSIFWKLCWLLQNWMHIHILYSITLKGSTLLLLHTISFSLGLPVAYFFFVQKLL